jgi:hypothetical protein
MAEADLIVGVTTHRLHYDPHLRAALDGGARALLAVQPTHVLHRLAADSEVVARTRSGAERLAKATTLTIGSERGTELSMAVSNRPALAHYGVADEPGHFDFWGAAMVEIAPLEGSVEGTLVLGRGDQIFHLGRYVDEQVTIQFERGRAVAIEGGAVERRYQPRNGSYCLHIVCTNACSKGYVEAPQQPKSLGCFSFHQSGRPDSNRGPPAPKADGRGAIVAGGVGHIVGTKPPEEDERGRNRTKSPNSKSPAAVRETRRSERFRNA